MKAVSGASRGMNAKFLIFGVLPAVTLFMSLAVLPGLGAIATAESGEQIVEIIATIKVIPKPVGLP